MDITWYIYFNIDNMSSIDLKDEDISVVYSSMFHGLPSTNEVVLT